MAGAYTSFEVEAERRREVLTDSMRGSRAGQPVSRDGGERNASGSRGLGRSAASLISWVVQRV